jgi:hypothetical protein
MGGRLLTAVGRYHVRDVIQTDGTLESGELDLRLFRFRWYLDFFWYLVVY